MKKVEKGDVMEMVCKNSGIGFPHVYLGKGRYKCLGCNHVRRRRVPM